MNVRRIAGWAVVIGLAYFLITDPAGAAGLATSALNGLKTVGTSLATFFTSL